MKKDDKNLPFHVQFLPPPPIFKNKRLWDIQNYIPLIYGWILLDVTYVSNLLKLGWIFGYSLNKSPNKLWKFSDQQ